MPVGGASVDVLEDINDRVSSPSLGMHAKKVSKLLQYSGILSQRFYQFQGEDVT